jgi:hypothetical protein
MYVPTSGAKFAGQASKSCAALRRSQFRWHLRHDLPRRFVILIVVSIKLVGPFFRISAFQPIFGGLPPASNLNRIPLCSFCVLLIMFYWTSLDFVQTRKLEVWRLKALRLIPTDCLFVGCARILAVSGGIYLGMSVSFMISLSLTTTCHSSAITPYLGYGVQWVNSVLKLNPVLTIMPSRSTLSWTVGTYQISHYRLSDMIQR